MKISGVVSAEHIEPSRRAFLARVRRTRGEKRWEVRAETAIGALRVYLRAEALVAATSDVHDLVGSVEVSRATRGGRGGWKNKVARTTWSLHDLLGTVPLCSFDKIHQSIQ